MPCGVSHLGKCEKREGFLKIPGRRLPEERDEHPTAAELPDLWMAVGSALPCAAGFPQGCLQGERGAPQAGSPGVSE